MTRKASKPIKKRVVPERVPLAVVRCGGESMFIDVCMWLLRRPRVPWCTCISKPPFPKSCIVWSIKYVLAAVLRPSSCHDNKMNDDRWLIVPAFGRKFYGWKLNRRETDFSKMGTYRSASLKSLHCLQSRQFFTLPSNFYCTKLYKPPIQSIQFSSTLINFKNHYVSFPYIIANINIIINVFLYKF